MKPKVSIIVPIYGVEKYIERCARSLFEQTLDDIEFIFVDDCTKDNSINILRNVIEQYPHRKNQIRILEHDVNMGLPIARKTGLQNVNGKYVIHCDSDDWLEPQMSELMLDKAESEDLDVVICDYYEDTGEKKIIHTIDEEKDNFYYSYFSSNNVCSVWNKCIKTTVYDNDIIYPIAGMGEDYALVIQLLFFAKKIGYIHQPLYHYFKNDNSITNAFSEESVFKRFDQSVTNMKTVMSFAQKHDLDKLYHYDLDKLKFRKRNNLIPLIKKWKYYKLWLNTFPEINIRILFNPKVSTKEKIKYIKMGLFH